MSRYRKTFTEALSEVYLSEKEITKLKNGVKVLGNALPNRAMAQKMADKANREMGHDADVYQSPFNNRFYVRIKEDINEQDDKDHEISMARGELEAIADKAMKLSSTLQGKSDDGNPLEAWVQSKITKAKDYINSVADYMMYNPDMANESHGPTVYSNDNGKIEIVDGEFHVYKGSTKTHHKTLDDAKQELGEAFSDAQVAQLKKAYDPMKGQKISIDNANKLMAIFNKFDKDKGALEKLVKAKIPFVSDLAVSRLISKHNYTADKIRPLKAGYMSEGTMIGGIIKHPGQPSAEYNKARLQYRTFMSKAQPAKGAEDKVLRFVFDDELLDDLYDTAKKNPTKDVRPMVKARLMKLGVKEEVESINEEDDTAKLKQELDQKDNEIAQLKQKMETDKAKNVQKQTQNMTNPETGEPLLKVGIAYKHLRDKLAKEKAAEARLKEKEAEQKKQTLIKFKDKIRKVAENIDEELNESDASDKAKAMGLTYMKFGRYGKDGKVTHKSIGGNLTKVDAKGEPIKDDEPKKDEPKTDTSKDEPTQKKTAVDVDKAKKDLEGIVTDGIVDVETDEEGRMFVTKEYEPSQDYEAEDDVEEIRKYFARQGVKPEDMVYDVDYSDDDEEDGYIQIQVQIRGPEQKEAKESFKLDEFNKKDYRRNEDENEHSLNALELVKKFGTPSEIKDMQGIYDRHMKRGHITEPDYSKRNAYDKKYYSKLRESVEEGRMSDIDAMRKKGASAAKIAKELGLDVKIVKDILGENTNHPAKELYESIEAVKNKAEKSGMPYSILKQVYDRGMAAWRGGHRPGATQVQWALARVNSFVTKSSGTWGGADKDLAAKVKGE